MILKEYAAIDIETKDGKTYSVDESGIIRDSLTTSSSCSSGGGIPAGSCNAGTISVSFRAPSGLAYSKLAKAKVHLYVWYGNASKTKVGVYNVTSAENNYGIYTVSGSDNVGLLDDGCYSAVDTKNAQNWLFTVLSGKFEPVSVIFNQICSAYGVPHYNSSENQKIIPESGNTMLCTCVSEECSIESVKDFASYLAEYLGCFIVPAPDGRLRFCRFGDRKCSVELNETNIQRGSYQRSPYYAAPTIWKISFDSGYGSWWYRTTDIPDNAAPLSVNLTNNPFWQAQEDMIPDQYSSKLTQMIKYMWSYICDAAYADDGNPCFNPFRCTVFVQYYFRVGDMVTIVDPFTGEKFKSYVTDVTWTFRGGQQISFAGEDTRTLSVNTNRNAAKKANDYSKYLYRKSKNGSGENVNTKYALSKSGHTITLTGSDGTVYNVTDDDTIYTHPSHAAHAKGFYKFANDDEGHVADAENVTKEDITALGIPGEDTNTTYELSINADGSNNSTDSTIYLNGSDGSSCSLLFDFTHKTEYGNTVGSLTKLYDDNFKIAVGIRYAPTKWIWESGATAATTVGVGYTDRDGTAATLITDFANDILVHNVVGHDNNTVTGKRNSVLGQNHTVSGSDNAVSGIHNAVSGYRNCVTGAEMTVAGDNDIVGGYRNTVTADHATVGGFVNTVTEHGDSSTVFGYGLYCDATIQAVFGRYNAKDPSVYSESQKSYYGKYALIVGNGSGDTDRSNAFAVDWDGKLWCGTDTTSLNAQIKSKAESTELAKYLPLTGGTMIGDIDMAANGADLLVGTQRSVRHGTLGTAIAGGAVDAKTSFADGLKARKSIVGTYTLANGTWVNLISVRHKNGYGDGINYGMYIYSLLTSGGNLIWNKQTAANTWQGERVLLDSANYTSYASDKNHTHPQITNSIMNLGSAGGAVKWIRLGTIVSAENGKTMVIRVWSGDGFNARTDQNSSFEIHIKDSWQSTQSATNACAVTVYRINCPSTVTVKVIPTDAVTYTVWIHPSPWTYWNGNYSVYGYYRTWTRQYLTQDAEPTGTGAAIAYYDQAFLTSTVAAAKTLTDSGWVAMTLGTYAASGAVQYRTYGKQITITGRIVLKTEIKTTPKAPQAIANTTLDFSKIKGCSGFGRSSTGIGICVQAEQYSDDNIVDVFSIGSNIAAGATLYFTITGFID